ncbi:uncharacterized protein LOC133900298 [Phragmites australis]|uniref:uncharacterized protein LOC133900298 n=1 Tax=Phragmites australis TaxID=29695 RepID=UPI002D78B58F|nr:uncharacterized protein LOC133900298 [Phragmites australis]
MSDAPPPQWVILAAVPRVAPTEDFPSGEHVSGPASFVAPPSLSYVTMSRWVCRDDATVDNYPCVVAVDPSGVFLLFASQGRAEGPLIVDRPDLYLSMQRDFHQSYFLCNPYIGLAGILPDPDRPILHLGNLGLMADPRRAGHYAIAELQPIGGSDHATLIRYSTAKGRWAEKELAYSTRYPEYWGSNGVASHDGCLWWVDLSFGLLACDPCARSPELRCVPLPDGCALPPAATEARLDLEKLRCVKPSAGKLRYVQIDRDAPSTVVSMWTLVDNAVWELDHRVPFAEIWDDHSYKDTGLEEATPVLALLHPRNPDVVYFWLTSRIFAVDLRARKVLECEPFHMDFPLMPVFHSSRFVHAWELPATPTLPRRHSSSSSTIRSASATSTGIKLHVRDQLASLNLIMRASVTTHYGLSMSLRPILARTTTTAVYRFWRGLETCVNQPRITELVPEEGHQSNTSNKKRGNA